MSGSAQTAADTDRISNLPEDVIGAILSRLSTKEAVATCVLSKNWRYKWTFINHIISETLLKLEDMKKTAFVNSVKRTLLLVQNAARIKLHLYSKLNSGAVMKSWVDSVSRHTSVEELDLLIPQESDFVFSSSLLNVNILRNLVLSAPNFAVSSKNHFPNLTNLNLWNAKVIMNQNVGDETLVFNFPVLETLHLCKCTWPNVKFVEIHAPALNKLISYSNANFITECDHYRINVHSTSLAHFISDGFVQENILLNGSAVVKAEMLHGVEREILRMSGVKVRSLLRQFSSSLKFLRLSVQLALAILKSRKGNSYPLLRFDKLETLFLYSRGYRHCTPKALLELLHAAPSLKVLIICLDQWTDLPDLQYYGSLPSCIGSSMEEVTLLKDSSRFKKTSHGIVKLLKNAGVTIKRCDTSKISEISW